VIIFVPSLGIETGVRAGTWRGLMAFKTQFGLSCAFLVTFLHAYCKFRFNGFNSKNLAYIFLLLLMCMGSQSYTAIGIVACYFALQSLAGHYNKININSKFALILLSIILIPILMFILEQYSNNVFSGMGKTDSIYTRFKMWHMILQGFIESPVIGYGLGRYLFLPGVLEEIQTAIWFFEISTMHNSFLEWALGAGLLAAICYIFILINTLIQSMKSFGNNQLGILLGPALVGFIGAFITSSIAFSNLFWIAPIMLAFLFKKTKVQRQCK
jgi:O-antigen ligase